MFGQQLENRLWFIELVAWWEGAVNTSHLIRQFNLSRAQAQQDLSQYKQSLPHNLYYSSSDKAWLPTESFNFGFINGDVVEYLNWVNRHDARPQQGTMALPHSMLTLPAREVSAAVMRVLVTAMRKQYRVEVDYVSVTNPNHEGRIIVPHHFVSTGLRWHLRAFCEKSGHFKDFVLSRFIGMPELLGPSIHTAAADYGWNTQVSLVIKPDPRLSPAQQAVLEADFQMQNGQLQLHTRGCLVQYLVQELHINVRDIDISPESQQLILANKTELMLWLFELYQQKAENL